MPELALHLEDLSVAPDEEVRLAVLGFPINHSISPQLHNAALANLAIENERFRNWKYDKIEVSSQDLFEALPQLAKLGYRGLNLTIPHKVEVLNLLKVVDPRAKAMGAVNTLSWENGDWKGYNTDGEGFSSAVSNSFGHGLNEFEVLVLGAGGAARAAIAQCLLDGCSRVSIVNRSVSRAKELIQGLRENGFEQDILLLSSMHRDWQIDTERRNLIVNATSLGLKESDPSPVDLEGFPKSTCLYDMIYNPLETKFLKRGRSLGMQTANGMSMLVGQAARSLQIWTGKDVSVPAMQKAAALAMNLG